MTYVYVNLNNLAQDILSARVTFEAGMSHVPIEEKVRFLHRLNRLIGTALAKSQSPDRVAHLNTLDGFVSAAITEARQTPKNRKPAALDISN